jgi:hypothetical protein
MEGKKKIKAKAYICKICSLVDHMEAEENGQ